MGAVRTAPRPFLTVKEVMILLGCKEDFAYKTMRKINKESESQGYISIGSGKVNKHLFADKLQIPEEDIEQAIQYVERCDCQSIRANEQEKNRLFFSQMLRTEKNSGQMSFAFEHPGGGAIGA